MRPPKHLGRAGRALWRCVVEEFELEPHHLVLLGQAAEALDRQTQARELMAAEGLTVSDRYGTPKLHPAASVERDARLALVRCLRELNLDGAQVERYSRPPLIAGGARYGRRAG